MLHAKKIVDLSHALTAETPVYPGDPIPNFSVATTIEGEGYNLFHVSLGSQSGSHVDAPFHFLQTGATVDRMKLDHFMGNGLVIDVSFKKAKEEITIDDLLPYADKLTTVDIVLFRTDWYLKAGTDAFFDHPYLSKNAGEYLLQHGILTTGIDAINLDNTGGTEFPIHDMYAEAGGIIAENLANFDQIDFEQPYLLFLPLRMIGCDGSPVRAVAIEFEQR